MVTAVELLDKVAQAQARDQSTIQFPYVHYEDALSVARTIHEVGGVPLSRDQLSAAMKDQGSFAAKLGAARMFGLVEVSSGRYQLTQLAYSALDSDENRQRSARATAFLNVPLYQKVYAEFRGKQLPPRPLGLENAFVGFGVAPKQKGNARIAFDRSAKQCGFFVNEQQDRLVEPILANVSVEGNGAGIATTLPDQKRNERVAADSYDFGTGVTVRDLHPFIEGLLAELPKPRSEWSRAKRVKWLQAAAQMFELIYEHEDNEPIGAIDVDLKKL